jgi:hypothetical protein
MTLRCLRVPRRDGPVGGGTFPGRSPPSVRNDRFASLDGQLSGLPWTVMEGDRTIDEAFCEDRTSPGISRVRGELPEANILCRSETLDSRAISSGESPIVK